MSNKIKANYSDKIKSKKDLIYVIEYTNKSEHKGWMSKEKYKKLYSPSDLQVLERQGVHGDSIGQGMGMWSKTFDKIMLDYDNNLYNMERKKEYEFNSYNRCVKSNGKHNCESVYDRLKQLKK